MAQERRETGSSAVSIETLYCKTIYYKYKSTRHYFASYPSYCFFTHRTFYTQTLLHRSCYTQEFLHTETFTHRRFYTQTPLHTDTFTRKHFYTQTLLHTDTFTHRRIYTQTLLHTEAFTHRRVYTQKLLHSVFDIKHMMASSSVANVCRHFASEVL